MCSNSAWFRSAEMKHVMIFTPEECAFDLINTLGNLGVMQFDDLNTHKTAFQRTYANSIKRCEEIERILTYIKGEAESMGVDMKDPPEITDFLNRTDDVQQQNTQANERISQMLQRLTSKEKEIRELQKTYAKLLNESNQKRELRYVLTEAMRLHREQDKVMDKTEITSDMGARIRFSRVTGVINTNDRSAFHRLVFRFSRGSCYLRFFDIFEGPQEEEVVFTDPLTGEFVHKTVFIAVFPGSKLRDKIDKICEAFGARIHDVPDVETVGAFESQIRDVTQWLAESEQYLSANRQRTRNILIGLASNYYRTVMQIRSMKGVFHVLNKCYVRKTGFVAARGWMLADKMDTVQDIVRRLGGVKGGGLTESSPGGHITSSPPTYFKTNKFTSVFQNTVDIYGIPRYQEANPALFTAVTFPFLFGVMFGDIGHGILFMMLGVYMVLNEKALGKVKNMNEMLKMAYDGRYMLLLMGIFAVYCGFIYNEFLCLGLDLFGSSYVTNSTMDRFYTKSKRTNYWLEGGVEAYGSNVYPFGLDPQWHMVPNELTFVNSFKMKLSVLLGVTQMTAGIALKWSNAIYFKDDLTFFFECIPQMLFMCCLFVYMCILILYKWTIDWQDAMKNHVDAPSLINTMINMALTMGGRGTEPELYSGQDYIQTILIIVALLCVPAMLIPKPLLLHRRNQASSSSSSSSSSRGAYTQVQTEEPDEEEEKEEDDDMDQHHTQHSKHHEETLMDLFIEQGIETIEFVLSCVSNTASYLRLWALSLAHAELAKTFWEMTMAGAINSDSSLGFVYITVGYAVFSASTFAVLLVMDPLECVLHALRLHWVEFQNKFYKADGTAFRPFCYRAILRPIVET